jgi:hypothetical protein
MAVKVELFNRCPGFFYAASLRHTDSPPGSLRAGLLLDRALLRQPSNLYLPSAL